MRALKKFLRSCHFLTISFFLCLTFLFITYLPDPADNSNPASARAYFPASSAQFQPDKASEISGDLSRTDYKELHGIIRAGDSLASSFSANNIDAGTGDSLCQAFGKFLDFNKIQPGESYSVTLDQDGRIVKASYQVNPFTSYTAVPSDNGLLATRDTVRIETRTVLLSGSITSSLFASFPDNLQNPKPIYAFADIFAAKLDFNTETREGDHFSLIIEEYYRDGEFIGYGPILAARYEKSDGEILEGFRFSPDGKNFNYYDAEGHEQGASFIRSPVKVGRVSSRFSRHRLHPILGVVRQHLGVDLAAPTGTPIMAAADGRVVSIGVHGGFGKQIVLAHAGEFRTYYGHLSRFKTGLKVGSRVKQKQIIGYVGATGLATGPHLDYRLQERGVFKNPFSLKFKPKSTLTGSNLQALNGVVADLQANLRRPRPEKLLAVQSLTLSGDRQPALL